MHHLFTRLQASGFAEVAGARVEATLPIADALLNALLEQYLPRDGAVRQVVVDALAGNRFLVRVRLTGPALLPALRLPLSIVQQPEFPARPELLLALAGSGALLLRLGGALGLLRTLPVGIRVENATVGVDLGELLARRGLAALLPMIERLQLTTAEGTVIVSLAVRVQDRPG